MRTHSSLLLAIFFHFIGNRLTDIPKRPVNVIGLFSRLIISQLIPQISLLVIFVTILHLKRVVKERTSLNLFILLVYSNILYKLYDFCKVLFNLHHVYYQAFLKAKYDEQDVKQLLKVDQRKILKSLFIPKSKFMGSNDIILKKHISYIDPFNPASFEVNADEDTRGIIYKLIIRSSRSLCVYVNKKNIDIIRNGDYLKCFVFIHGGGWRVGHSSQVYQPSEDIINSEEGYVFISVDYSVKKQATVNRMSNEIRTAIVWVKHNISYVLRDMFKQSFSTKVKIVICGQSAGGHLALSHVMGAGKCLLRGYENSNASVVGCISLYGVSDLIDSLSTKYRVDHGKYRRFVEKSLIQRRIDEGREANEVTCPFTTLRLSPPSSLPPIFSAHGINDILVPIQMADNFHHYLDAEYGEGQGHVLVRIPKGRHAFEVINSPFAITFSKAQEFFTKSCFERSL